MGIRDKSAFWVWVAVIPGLLLWVYGPCLWIDYGVVDDFFNLAQAKYGNLGWIKNFATADGRPLYGLALKLLFGAYPDTEALSLARWISLCTGALFACLVARKILKEGGTKEIAAVGTILLCLNPASAVFISWSSCFPYFSGAILAFSGGLLVLEGVKVRTTLTLLNVISGAMLLLLSELLYTPVAGTFLLPFIIHTLFSSQPEKWALVKGLSVLGLMMLAYFFLMGPLREFSGAEAFEYRLHRTGLGFNLSGKFAYLVNHWILNVLGFWGAALGGWKWVAILSCLLLIGFDISCRFRGLRSGERLLFLAGISGAFFLISGPFLVLQELHENYRILFVPFLITQLLLLSGIGRITRRLSRLAIVIPVMAFFAIGAGISVREGMVHDNAEILELSTAAILEAEPVEGPPFYLGLPDGLLSGSTKGLRRFEFGGWDIPSWAVEALAGLLIDKRRGINQSTHWPDVRVLRLPETADFSVVQGFEVLSLIPIHADEGVTHPLLGRQEMFSYRGRTYLSGFLGTVEILTEKAGFIELASSRFGRLSVTGENPDNLWVHREDVGWIWTSQKHFPIGWTKDSVEKVLDPLD